MALLFSAEQLFQQFGNLSLKINKSRKVPLPEELFRKSSSI